MADLQSVIGRRVSWCKAGHLLALLALLIGFLPEAAAQHVTITNINTVTTNYPDVTRTVNQQMAAVPPPQPSSLDHHL